jgi:hypothetical protein
MTDSGTVDVHIGPCDHMNDIRVNLWLSCDVPFASQYFIKPRMCRYPLESSHAHYTVILVTGSSFSLLCSGIPVTKSPVSGQTMMDAVTLRGP